jgi:hypothetical protein
LLSHPPAPPPPWAATDAPDPGSADAAVAEHDLMLDAIFEYLGLEWCTTCGQIESANRHGSRMGFPEPEAPVAPGPL